MTRRGFNGFGCLAALLVACCWLTMNLQGQQSPHYAVTSHLGRAISNLWWVHGWPMAIVVREVHYDFRAGKGVTTGVIRGKPGEYSQWPFDNAPVYAQSLLAACVNLAIGGVIVFGAFLGARRIAVRFHLRLRLTTRTLLILMTVIAYVLLYRGLRDESEHVIKAVAITGCLIGLVLSVVALMPWQGVAKPDEASPSVRCS